METTRSLFSITLAWLWWQFNESTYVIKRNKAMYPKNKNNVLVKTGDIQNNVCRLVNSIAPRSTSLFWLTIVILLCKMLSLGDSGGSSLGNYVLFFFNFYMSLKLFLSENFFFRNKCQLKECILNMFSWLPMWRKK